MGTEEAKQLKRPGNAAWLEPEGEHEARAAPPRPAGGLAPAQEAEGGSGEQRHEAAHEAAEAQEGGKGGRQWHEPQWQKAGGAEESEEGGWEQQFLACRARAREEGVVEPEWWGGAWWAQLPDGSWKECMGKFYCVHCSKHLNEMTLEAHMRSDGHQRRLAWLGEGPGPGPASQTPRPPAAPPSTASEEWRERAQTGPARPARGGGRAADEASLAAGGPRESQDAATSGHEEPELPYLALVPSDESDPSSERWMKCLLCRKWLNDNISHSGTFEAPSGSKEHQKNLRNYRPGDPWWEERVARERRKWHPPASAAAPHAAGPPSQPPASAGARPRGQPPAGAAAQPSRAPAAESPPRLAGVGLPAGWEAARDQTERLYYFNRAQGKSQWERPPLAESCSPPPPRPPSPPHAPPGWTTHKYPNGEIYYHNGETGEYRWQLPSLAAGPAPGEVPTPFGRPFGRAPK